MGDKILDNWIMGKNEFEKKIERAINLLKSIPSDDIELCFSGGKDSSVILELAKMAGIKFTPIYKNTTIDPSGNIAFCKSMGCEIVQPKETFIDLIKRKGFPTRRARFCCEALKEYKIKDYAIVGVRKSESTARAKRYNEPEMCRIYGNGGRKKKDGSNYCKHYYPILDWTNEDIEQFVKDYNIVVNPLYYRDGQFDVTKRLGCLCCPLQNQNKLQKDFLAHPQMVRLTSKMVWFGGILREKKNY